MFNKLTRSLEIALHDRASSFFLQCNNGGPDEEVAGPKSCPCIWRLSSTFCAPVLRGGMTTKLPAAVDEDEVLCDFVLCAGSFHDLTAARLMTESFRGAHLVGDKDFDSQAFRQELVEHGAADSRIPRKGHHNLDEQPQPFDRENYTKRHLIENFFQRTQAPRSALRENHRILCRVPRFRGSPGQISPRLI